VSVLAAPTTVEVAIIGGGLVGASLAAALAGGGRRVLLIEGVAIDSAAQPSFDERTTALGNASRRIYEGLALWPQLQPAAAAIRTIHVSDAGRFGFARLEAREQGIEAFGYVIANRHLGRTLWQRLATAPNLTLRVPARVSALEIGAAGVTLEVSSGQRCERFVAQLLVAADGAQSQVRAAAGIEAGTLDYRQVAVVANVASDVPHGGVAYERFTPAGPLAVLPLIDGARAVIWACEPERAQELLVLEERAYLAQLQANFGWRAGRFVRAGRRNSYPLSLTRANATTAQRTVLIGNAAQALHPVAGQGFNLGLRDAAMLAELLAATGDAGDGELLARFAAWRARDRAGVVAFTDGLIRLFGSRRAPFGLLRNLGLLLFDLTPPAKSALARVSGGFAGPAPRLARGLPLS
jgi:2-octaprenyl-6-methoxyphenol hydroxylase